VLRREEVDRPLGDQPVATCSDQHAGERHDAVADLGSQPAADQRADRQRDQEAQK
jgi:hypothetical protein